MIGRELRMIEWDAGRKGVEYKLRKHGKWKKKERMDIIKTPQK
jgi:hypothetical protein